VSVGVTNCAQNFTKKYRMSFMNLNSFIHFIFHISIYRLNTKDVEIVIVVVTISGKVTNVRCVNTIIIQWSYSN
jgi:hypothetical protein